jgi:hypothetical protein
MGLEMGGPVKTHHRTSTTNTHRHDKQTPTIMPIIINFQHRKRTQGFYFLRLVIIFFYPNLFFCLYVSRSINPQIVEKIHDFCAEYSNVAANRTKQIGQNGEKITVPLYFLTLPYVHLHHEFVRKNPECQISLSTLKKYIPKNYVRGSQKKTDMCHYCVNGKKTLVRLEKLKRSDDFGEEIQLKIQKVNFFLGINFFLNPHWSFLFLARTNCRAVQTSQNNYRPTACRI